MPKTKHVQKLKFYDKENYLVAEVTLRYYNYSSFIRDFLDYAKLLSEGQFTYVTRIDLVSSNRVLYSICDLRHVVNQKNYSINFNPY